MILSTLSTHPHTKEHIERLADMGFDYVCVRTGFHRFTQHSEWREAASLIRDAGMKLLLTWPTYADFQRGNVRPDDPQYAFKGHDGRSNTTVWTGFPISGRLEQFSHWNDEAERVLIASLADFLEDGPEIDGVHVNVSSCDRMFPTDWYPYYHVDGAELYWSFDASAQAKWAEYSAGKAMPIKPSPVLTLGGGLLYEEDEFFYRWYQDGWINRLTRLSHAVLDAGLKHISTWVMPHTRFTAVNMANGTAGCIDPLEGWRQHMISHGAYPLLMVGYQFGLQEDWPQWYADGEESIRRMCTAPYNWDLIVGAECDISPNITAVNVRHHARVLAEWGASGLLCGDSYWIGTEYADEIAEAMNDAHALFDAADDEAADA